MAVAAWGGTGVADYARREGVLCTATVGNVLITRRFQVNRLRPVTAAGRAASWLSGFPVPHHASAIAMTDPRLETLLQSCPGLRLKTEPADLEHYGRDWTRRWTPAP